MHARELFSKDERWQEMKTKQKKKKKKTNWQFFWQKKVLQNDTEMFSSVCEGHL